MGIDNERTTLALGRNGCFNDTFCYGESGMMTQEQFEALTLYSGMMMEGLSSEEALAAVIMVFPQHFAWLVRRVNK